MMSIFQYFTAPSGPVSAPVCNMAAEQQEVQPEGAKLRQLSGIEEISTETALAQQSMRPREGAVDTSRYGAALGIPIELDVAVPIKRFRVRNLISLAAGTVIESEWTEGADMPLGARGAQLAWSEFEVIDQKLAVRITRLV